MKKVHSIIKIFLIDNECRTVIGWCLTFIFYQKYLLRFTAFLFSCADMKGYSDVTFQATSLTISEVRWVI